MRWLAGENHIETRNVEWMHGFARTRFDQPGSYVLLCVTDTGIGMDKATIEHIFEPFFTTKCAGKGTGLGLATVYGIVKQHGGLITRKAGPPGTCFRVYLPSTTGAHAPETARYNEPPRGTETILLAEDHEGLRNSAQEMLQNLGYRVIVAADGKESLELFKISQQINIEL